MHDASPIRDRALRLIRPYGFLESRMRVDALDSRSVIGLIGLRNLPRMSALSGTPARGRDFASNSLISLARRSSGLAIGACARLGTQRKQRFAAACVISPNQSPRLRRFAAF
jgi:hypothetical protein